MARNVLPVNDIVVSGLSDPAPVAGIPADDHEFTNDDRNLTFLRLENTDGSTRVVTIEIPGELESGLDNPNREISLTAGQVKFVGPFNSDLYNQPDTELVYVDVDSALVLITVFQLEGE